MFSLMNFTEPMLETVKPSGKYNVSYPNASTIDLATRVKERWSVAVDGVSLEVTRFALC